VYEEVRKHGAATAVLIETTTRCSTAYSGPNGYIGEPEEVHRKRESGALAREAPTTTVTDIVWVRHE
jgi:hypothetical protein